ncbi:sulfotransferase [Paracoccus nototheniae]|uniref:Sulfotransferase n=1 Tax=Paracoccus nototheniae TaxID=2489002 RepID=A0ABW4DVX8_9RHOB|nr:sulfotransferase [Paracoccus nototheniae]
MLKSFFSRKRPAPPMARPETAFSHELGMHRLQFEPGNGTLVVSFDNAARPGHEAYDGRPTWGDAFYRDEGYSLLGVIARQAVWYRDADLIRALNKMRDDGFFASFDRVVMTGGSMGGFAAAAFAGLVPGAVVISFSPQSTLKKGTVPWEWRFAEGRAQNWRLPYGEAADGIGHARHCYVLYDSLDRLDARHAARFGQGATITHLKLPGGGHGVSRLLSQMGILKQITREMIDTTLTPDRFQTLARRRKGSAQYHIVMASHAMARKRPELAGRICTAALPRFPQSPDLERIRNEAAKTMNTPDKTGQSRPPAPPMPTDPAMTPTPSHRLTARFPQLKRNIFIITYGRTGSTLLQSLVQTLPGCTMRGENHNVIEPIWSAAMRARLTRGSWGKEQQPENHPWYGADLMRPSIFGAGMIDALIDHVLQPPRDAKYFGFKEIRYNALGDRFPNLLEFMRYHFKDPLFIFNTRNVSDVAQSAWWKNWKEEDVKALVHDMDKRFADYHAAHPDHSIMMSYESFSRDPLAMKPLFDKLDEPFDQAQIEAVLGVRLKH